MQTSCRSTLRWKRRRRRIPIRFFGPDRPYACPGTGGARFTPGPKPADSASDDRVVVCLEYALLWFALWWELFGESLTESGLIPKRRAGDGWIAVRPAQPGLLRAAVLDFSVTWHSVLPRSRWRRVWPPGSSISTFPAGSRIRHRQMSAADHRLMIALARDRCAVRRRSTTPRVPSRMPCARISMLNLDI